MSKNQPGQLKDGYCMCEMNFNHLILNCNFFIISETTFFLTWLSTISVVKIHCDYRPLETTKIHCQQIDTVRKLTYKT